MTFDFKEVLAKWLRSKGLPVTKVTSYDDGAYGTGGCDTCSYTEYEVDIYYRTPGETRTKVYTYDGRMSSLIQELELLD